MTEYTPGSEPSGQVVGLVPAGGLAARLAPLPCSKELLPVGFRPTQDGRSLRPKVACHYLLESMRLSGISRAYIVLRQGKWDIPAYLGDGDLLDMHLAYLLARVPYGAPFSLDQAYPFVGDSLVALGFPDIIFQPEDAFGRLLAHQAATQADVVLGAFPTRQLQECDMLELDDEGSVRRILVKPGQTDLRYTWIIAVWTPKFGEFMHNHLISVLEDWQVKAEPGTEAGKELFMGDVFQAAIKHQAIQVETALFPDGRYLDIGTPDNLVKAVRGVERFLDEPVVMG